MPESELSPHAAKLAAYARQFHKESPAATPDFCMTMAAGQLTMEIGDNPYAASFAMKELAAQAVFVERT